MALPLPHQFLIPSTPTPKPDGRPGCDLRTSPRPERNGAFGRRPASPDPRGGRYEMASCNVAQTNLESAIAPDGRSRLRRPNWSQRMAAYYQTHSILDAAPNDSFGASRAVPATRADRPLSVQSRDLRGEAREQARRAETGRSRYPDRTVTIDPEATLGFCGRTARRAPMPSIGVVAAEMAFLWKVAIRLPGYHLSARIRSG
jgi:hypothetical protein